MVKVMLDTCALIALVKQEDAHHRKTLDIVKFALQNNYQLLVSPIALSEYCVRHSVEQLLSFLRIKVLPFAEKHAVKSGELHRLASKGDELSSRIFVKNDTRILAQASEDGVNAILTYDEKMMKRITSWRDDGHISKLFPVIVDKGIVDESCFIQPEISDGSSEEELELF